MSSHKNILILTQWSYKDPLIQAYTLPYVYIISKYLPEGSKIFLVTFEQERLKMTKDERKEITSMLALKGIQLVDYSYSKFGVWGMIKWLGTFLHLFLIILSNNIKFIHAWCTPAASLGYVLSIVTGRPLVIDSYEPHAEAMVENNTWSPEGLKFKILFYLEKKLSKHASIFISAASGMKEYAQRKYGVIIENIFVKPACVDMDKFNITKRKNARLMSELELENKIVCVYAGKFGGIYLTTEVFDFFHQAELKWGNKFRVLLLTPHDTAEINEWAATSSFDIQKMIVRFVPHDKIQDYMGLGDFGITPVKSIPTKRYCTPIKDGEYWALGMPVVITKNISDDSEIIFSHNAGAVLESLDTTGYQKAIDKMDDMLSEPKDQQGARIIKLAEQYRNFSIAEKIYSNIYKN